MKYTPNILSISRILLALVMFCLSPLQMLFWFLYFLCGISDMLDGYLARKYNCTSHFGAQIDSFGDIIFLAIAFIKCFPILNIPSFIWGWMLMIAVVRIISMKIGSKRNKSFTSLHTRANKVTGFLLFITPVFFEWSFFVVWEAGVCIIASFSALQELSFIVAGKKE